MRRYLYYPEETNEIWDLCLTSDNGIVFTGQVFGPPDWVQSMWVQKLDSIGCDSAGCDPTVWVRELNAQNISPLEIYPNPASEYIAIRTQETCSGEILIYNTFGEVVKSTKASPMLNSYTFDVSSLAPGMYIAIMRDEKRIVARGKFVVGR